MASLGHFVTYAFRQIAAAILRHYRSDLGSVFLKLGWVRDDVLT
jgi:hypothetical protein